MAGTDEETGLFSADHWGEPVMLSSTSEIPSHEATPVAVKAAAELRQAMHMVVKAKQARRVAGDDQLGWDL